MWLRNASTKSRWSSRTPSRTRSDADSATLAMAFRHLEVDQRV